MAATWSFAAEFPSAIRFATSGAYSSSWRSSKNRLSTPEHNATTTSLTVTPNRFLIALMSCGSSWAKATLRARLKAALNLVGGAANGAAIVAPRRARKSVCSQVQLAICELQTKFGHRVDAQHHRVAEPVKGVTTRHRRGVQLHDAAHVQRLRRGSTYR